jgi:CheY-like chemotaxis protein
LTPAHRASGIGNEKQAMAAARSLPYDLVLMDMMTPEIDGVVAIWATRARRGAHGSVPVGGVTAEDLVLGARAGYAHRRPATCGRLDVAIARGISADAPVPGI